MSDYRVLRSFAWEGQLYNPGDVLRQSNPVEARVVREWPWPSFFTAETTRAETRCPRDRAPLKYRNVRIAARERPELFVMEYVTEPVDQVWLAELERRYDLDYEQAKRGREEAKARQKQALRDEYEAQGHGPSHSQRELEKRFKQQEKERAEREKAVREDRERQKLEAELAFDLQSGFHYDR